MLELITTRQFERDLKTLKKRGKKLDKLWLIVELLLNEQLLTPRHKPHPLVGNWRPCWECHVEPDWLLIWLVEDNELTLTRSGTHSDLF